jgi:hypothetical protein
VSVASVLVLAVGLSACDDDSGGSASHRKPRPSSSTRSSSSTSSTSSTTVSPDPSASETTTVPVTPGTCGGQLDAITAAVGGSDPTLLTTYALSRCRLAPSSPTWAAADLVPKTGSGAMPKTAVLERVGALWTVRAISSAGVACDATPPQVRAGLGLSCP